MATVYEQLFSDSIIDEGKKNYAKIINSAFRQSRNSITNDKAKIISKYLTDIYYPTESTSQDKIDWNKRITNWAQAYLTNSLDRAIQNFNFSDNTITQQDQNNKINNYKIIQEEYEQFQHENRIAYETIVQRIEKIQAKRKEIGDINQVEKDMQELVENYNKLLEEYTKIKEQYENSEIVKDTDKSLHYLNLKNNIKLKQIIKETDEIYKKVVILEETNIPNWLSGYLFEASMQMIANQGKEELIDYTLGQIIETTGGGAVERGKLNIHKNGIAFLDTKIKVEKAKTKSGKESANKYTIQVGKQSKITIEETFTKKQAKTDVIFDFSFLFGTTTPVRASIKNWSSIGLNGEHDFGETTIFDALTRVTEDPRTYLKFGLQIGYAVETKKTDYEKYVEMAHTFAQLCLILDVVIGFSQEKGNADMIIINDRKNRCVKVYRITSILNGIKDVMNKTLEENKYTSYSASSIEDAIKNCDIEWGKELSNQNYAELLYIALTKINYTVYDRILQLDKSMTKYNPNIT